VHIDHFVGFDVLLRVLVGREKTVHLSGPSEFIERVAHKLHGYEWNLADLFQYDLGFAVTELDVSRTARFRLKNAFTAEPLGARRLPEQVIHSEPRLPPSISGTHVRFGSLADITARSRHVRFTPDSGH
jgi:ribonuclease Z